VVLEQYDLAILEWEQLIDNFKSSNYWTDSFDEIAYTQWAYLNNPKLGAETYLNFVETYSFMDEAPIFLYRAARMYERADELQLAADIWTRVAAEYPAYELAFRSQQLTGISLYRLGNFQSAQSAFETLLLYAAEPEEFSAAHFWLAKTYQSLEMTTEAAAAWEEAITQSPDSYYGIRAKQIADQIPSFEAVNPFLTPIDLVREKESAATWMQSEFLLEANFEQPARSTLQNDEIIRQAQTYWKLGYYSESFALLEEARQKYAEDPVKLFSLIDLMLNLGSYRSAAFASRQIIDLAQADPDNLLTVPKYFNHIRYGTFYPDLVLQAAADYDLSPMLLFSQIRQESLFDSQVGSSAGAMGVMQIISQTGQQIADQLRDPADYVTDDLFLPAVNIEYGTYYLDLQRDYFDGNLYLALAAYNAGPGNTEIWFSMADEDIDLFLEIIRFGETRDYLLNITETFQVYQNLYQEPVQ
jgi:soluble lytic murein transglycosylase